MKTVLKILTIVILTGMFLLSIYFLLPKYQFFEHGRVRCNKITGKIEVFKDLDTGWVEFKTPKNNFGAVPDDDFGFIPEKE